MDETRAFSKTVISCLALSSMKSNIYTHIYIYIYTREERLGFKEEKKIATTTETIKLLLLLLLFVLSFVSN